MVSAAGDFVYAKFSEINGYNSTFLLFLPSIVMILLAFLSCLLVFFSSSFFSIKANHCVFELSVLCVCLFHCVIATEFDYRI